MTVVGATFVFAGGQVLTADQMNTYISERIEQIAGRDGVREFEDTLVIQNGTNGDHYFGIPEGTTAQRPASPEGGWVRHNTTVTNVEWWNGSAWEDNTVVAADVTFEALQSNGDVGAGSGQIARGNHTHG